MMVFGASALLPTLFYLIALLAVAVKSTPRRKAKRRVLLALVLLLLSNIGVLSLGAILSWWATPGIVPLVIVSLVGTLLHAVAIALLIVAAFTHEWEFPSQPDLGEDPPLTPPEHHSENPYAPPLR